MMSGPMPSPLAHAMAGVIVTWSAERLPTPIRPITRAAPPLLAVAVALAVFPDIDLLWVRAHRTYSHSVTAMAFVTIFAAAVTRWVTGRTRWGAALVCGAAYGSHLVLDWLGEDFNVPQGIQAFWPFSDGWFLSGWDIFRSTQRQRPLSWPSVLHNIRTAAQELSTMGPVLLILWFTRRRASRTKRPATLDRRSELQA
jgi:hypothetical protein